MLPSVGMKVLLEYFLEQQEALEQIEKEKLEDLEENLDFYETECSE